MTQEQTEYLKSTLDLWPFTGAREELGVRTTAFDTGLPPVFFVGDPWGPADYLAVGLKPGRNADSSAGFEAERAALGENAASYKSSRLDYFVSDGLNRRHYWPIAKQIAVREGLDRPTDLGRFLQDRVVQVEMFPFFAHSNTFRQDDWIALRKETQGGRIADAVFRSLVQLKPWKALIIRYAASVKLFRACYPENVEGELYLVDGHSIPILELPGRSPSFPTLQTNPNRRRRRESSSRAKEGLISEAELGLRNSSGRRWAVSQAFVDGGSIDMILRRAQSLYETRCAELGELALRDIEVDRPHPKEGGFYPKHFRQLGWQVTYEGGVWKVERPRS